MMQSSDDPGETEGFRSLGFTGVPGRTWTDGLERALQCIPAS